MKRLVLFGIAIFLIIIGGFLVVDKVWLHKIFIYIEKPGKCLILDDRYCNLLKTIEVPYGKVLSAKMDGTNIFVPIDGSCDDSFTIYNFSSQKMEEAILIENKINDRTYQYRMLFNKGNPACKSKTIKKGGILTAIKKDNKTEITFQIISWKNDDKENSVLEEDLENKLLTK